MKCDLCDEEITAFDPLLNSLKINEDRTINICRSCFNKIVDWQRKVFDQLFPRKHTKARRK